MITYTSTGLFYDGLLKGIKMQVNTPFDIKRGSKCKSAICGSSYIIRKVTVNYNKTISSLTGS